MTGKFYVYFERKLPFADTLCTYLHCLTGRILTFFIYFSGVFQVVYLDKNNSVAICNILAIIKIYDMVGSLLALPYSSNVNVCIHLTFLILCLSRKAKKRVRVRRYRKGSGLENLKEEEVSENIGANQSCKNVKN